MDGGMGTTLQAPPFSRDIDSALWSSEILADEQGREMLVDLHRTWIDNGAELIGSCSYQSFLPLFLPLTTPYPPGSHEQALGTMLSALNCITSPKLSSSSSSSSSSSAHNSKPSSSSTSSTSTQFEPRGLYPILSLGPFGALCSPGQEYSGLYPKPFGSFQTPSKLTFDSNFIRPLSSSSQFLSLIEQIDSKFEMKMEMDEELNSLIEFHYQRLNDFVKAEEWNSINLIAFETIPILKEIKAIRMALKMFNSELGSDDKEEKDSVRRSSKNADRSSVGKGLKEKERMKKRKRKLPSYISFVFPVDEKGRTKYPDKTLEGLELNQQIEQILKSCFGEENGQGKGEERIEGIGINCSNPSRIREILEGFHSGMKKVFNKVERRERPWLILYPDGGAVYDVFTKTWSNPSGMSEDEWASLLVDNVEYALAMKADDDEESMMWGGVIAGGCCKASPAAIKALSLELKKRGVV